MGEVRTVSHPETATIAYNTWHAATLSVVFWSLFYFAVKKTIPERSAEYCSRVLALCHGSLMGFYGLDQCFNGNSLFDNPNEPTSNEQAFILVVSLGYFVVDLGWCLYYQTETALMVAHHFYSCFALSRMLFKGSGGHVATCGLGGLEITNPLLQMRWFTRTYGYHDTPFFVSVEFTFLIMFFLIRIVLGSVYVALIVLQPKSTWEFTFLTLLIYVMSWMFMVNIFKYFTCKYLRYNTEVELVHINTS